MTTYTSRTTTSEPEVGAAVTLIPSAGPAVEGEITLWSPGAGGVVVTSRVRTTPAAAGALRGERVWLRAASPDNGLVVFQAVAEPVAGQRDELELIGVRHLATETRRTALRAPVVRPILLLQDGQPSRGTSTLDLSSSGVRVMAPQGQQFVTGERVRAAVDVQGGTTVWARGEVVRVEADGAVALRFVEVDGDDAQLLDRDVLSWLSDNAQ